MNTFTSSASVLLLALALAPVSAEAGVFRVVSIDSKVTESNDTWERHSWILKVRNAGQGDLSCRGEIQWLDRGGFVVDDDPVSFTIRGNQTLSFRNYALIDTAVSRTVHTVATNLGCDPL